jgi:hypothetical protein
MNLRQISLESSAWVETEQAEEIDFVRAWDRMPSSDMEPSDASRRRASCSSAEMPTIGE